MAWCVHPFEYVDRAVLETGAVANTDVEVDGNVCAVDPQLFRFVHRSPDCMPFMSLGNFTGVLRSL